MDGLAAFWAARLDEAEAAANEVHRPRVCGSVDNDGAFDADPIWCSCDGPARVLRDVEADRKLLAELKAVRKLAELTGGKPDPYRDWVARIRAAVYDAHPDYRQEWKP